MHQEAMYNTLSRFNDQIQDIMQDIAQENRERYPMDSSQDAQ